LDVKMLYYSKFTLIIPWSQVQILLGALNPSPVRVAGIFLGRSKLAHAAARLIPANSRSEYGFSFYRKPPSGTAELICWAHKTLTLAERSIELSF